MAFIELHPQLKQTNELLDRIAKVLERTLLEKHGVRMGHCAEKAADPHPEVEPTIAYHTDEDTLREDLKALAGHVTEEEDEDV